jgi:ABC-type glycerol-3-phosphate transport system substrate-binding protein
MGDDGATVSDILRTLNTEIMAGKGPDIIMLDGLSADNYIDKGVLHDLTDLVSEEKQKEDMIESVLKSFERGGKIFAVPAKFSMPTMFVDAETAELVRDISSLANFADMNQDVGVIGDKTAENLFKIFLPGSMPGWLTGKEIDEAKLAEYLEAVKKMADTEAPALIRPERTGGERVNVAIGIARGGGGSEFGESNSDDVFNFAYERIHTFVSRLTSFRGLMTANMATEYRGGCAAVPLPGLVDSVFIPSAITGIHAASGNIDIACDFLKMMLSKELQSVKLGDGFAVNVSALESTLEEEGNYMIALSMRSEAFEGDMLTGGIPSIEEQRKILDLCLGVKTPYIVNDTLASMVSDEAKGYFSGEKDLEKAIADIRERTRIYLAE